MFAVFVHNVVFARAKQYLFCLKKVLTNAIKLSRIKYSSSASGAIRTNSYIPCASCVVK